jgi:hypothetical protein
LETVQSPAELVNIKEASPLIAVTTVIDPLPDGIELATPGTTPIENLPATKEAGIAEANPQGPKEHKVPTEENPRLGLAELW